MIDGYARDSTDGQSVEAQVAALTAAGAVTVSRTVTSGATTSCAQLRQVRARLAAITGIDTGCTSLGDAWADTTMPHGRTKARRIGLGRRPKLTPSQKRERMVNCTGTSLTDAFPLRPSDGVQLADI